MYTDLCNGIGDNDLLERIAVVEKVLGKCCHAVFKSYLFELLAACERPLAADGNIGFCKRFRYCDLFKRGAVRKSGAAKELKIFRERYFIKPGAAIKGVVADLSYTVGDSYSKNARVPKSFAADTHNGLAVDLFGYLKGSACSDKLRESYGVVIVELVFKVTINECFAA